MLFKKAKILHKINFNKTQDRAYRADNGIFYTLVQDWATLSNSSPLNL